ncbi:NADH/ubiquinone/plastoquinone (complex I) [Thermanaerosceptrum fracticalcis]|uniref:NADH/ubiquinone/plastoquinone (Complex I) n=1 Tax=Thermanaerosceptrum fracticalcis TaxID=1712410 RepID=A0A7G6E4Q9_THEFR|nr:monovalent cation/H+ antiporter subunit D family protein [Thermanaerosceptrum fracticalcis]QNB47063.1 NADH/ubiquinone/plastoquinone (complex I) [Thermanaerosceptrum fracticalcis]
MREQLPALIIIVPLLAALAAPLIAYLSTRLLRIVIIGAILVSHLSALGTLLRVLAEGPWHYRFGGWLPPWGIEYVIDPLSGSMAVLISFISLVVAIYSGPFFKADTWLRKGIFYALYALLTTGLLGMVVTGDVFNLYVFLEISSLAAYALIASGGHKATVAAFRYLLIGTVGASFYLLGIGYLYAITGSLNMADLVHRLQPLMDSPAVLTAVVMLVVGMGIKMALFPMHGWLPDAYTYAPPPATAFISGVMTKVSAYVLFRFFFFVLGAMNGPVPAALTVVGWAAAVGIIIGSVMAIAQTDFRRMLAYSSVAQIGYIALGLAIGNTFALIGAVLHILNHAVMKSCLFLVAGGVKWKTGEHTIEKYAELSRRMPLTMGAFLIAALSMVGLPPTAGFFSKWYLVLGAMEARMWPYIVVIILSSLLNAVYFFRVIEHVYMKKAEPKATEENGGGRELPVAMLVPIVLLGVGILVIGVLNEPIVTQILQYALPGGGR